MTAIASPLEGARRALARKILFAVALCSSATLLPRFALSDPPPSAPDLSPAATARTPRGAATGFLLAARAGRYRDAAEFLDLSELPEAERTTQGPLLARHLKFVLDQKLWIDLEALSDFPEGNRDDGLPEDREWVGVIHARQGPVEIRLRRLQAPDGAMIWKFGRGTVGAIPLLWEQYGLGWLGDQMPPALYEIRIRELELWQLIGLFVLAAAAYGAARLLTIVGGRIARARARRLGRRVDEQLLASLRLQFHLIVATALFFAGTYFLRLSVPAQRKTETLIQIFLVLVFAWMTLKIVDAFFGRLRERLEREGHRQGVSMALLGRRVAKIAIGVLVFVVILQQTGFQVSGLLAGLGIGGAAIALASQKTLANLFGGLTLGMDQPVRVGDMCRVGTTTGWVEEVGLRSTRIRTLDRTILTVPNAEISELQIENFSLRDRMRLQTVVSLRYETKPAQLREVLARLRALLSEHPRVSQDILRVRFSEFGSYSLDIEILTYVLTADWDEFLAIREEIYLRIMDIVAECGASFAFPSQTLYLGRDSELAGEADPPGIRREGG